MSLRASTARRALLEKNKADVAFGILSIINRQWFGAYYQPPLDHTMATFLIVVYAFAKRGTPASKKVLYETIGVEDIKTARKYMQRAEEMLLIRTGKSTADGRKILVYPTPKLCLLIEDEVREVIRTIKTTVIPAL